MRCVARALVRMALALIIVIGALAVPVPSSRAAPAAQRGDGLDTPLLTANMCGPGLPGETHFTFAATGDTFPHENIQAVGEAQGYDYLFDYLRPFLQAADIGYTNFDGAMLEGSAYTGYPNFNYNPKLAPALKNAGIGVVSTANNHIMDRGPEGLDATLNVLQQAGILQHGAVLSTAAEQPRPAYLPITLSRDGVSIKIGFLSFTWGTNGIPDPYQQVNLLWQGDDYGQQSGLRQSVLDAIAQARRETDVVIVAAHWGYEYQSYPADMQIEGARQMAAAGADVILGAQPHTLQPVDVIETNGRQTLVIYSLANFIASQGAFQDAHFSATSVIFYVGLVRAPDGTVRVSGYRYLPTIHIDNDTRPAPIPANEMSDVQDHVRLMMRDFAGARQVSPDPAALGSRVAVCPGIVFPDAPGLTVPGDFAQHFATLGGGAPRSLLDAVAVFGYPLGPVRQEPTGDCAAITSVLYTERQRLEWHPERPWPFRVIGSQIGVEVYKQKYKVQDVPRRTNLDGDAIANEPFKAFFQAYGGLEVFGYPISGALSEQNAATGQERTVQYFERARFELVPAAASGPDQPAQVQLGLLGREYAGIASHCGAAVAAATATARALPTALANAAGQAAPARAARESGGWGGWLLSVLAILVLLAGLVWAAAVWDARRRPSARRRRAARRRATRRNPAAPVVPAAPTEAPTPARPAARIEDDDELLRRLLEE